MTVHEERARSAPTMRRCICTVQIGDRHGFLVVRQLLTASEAGHPRDGAWAWVKCDCGKRRLIRARHLRLMWSCGCKQKELAVAIKRARRQLRFAEMR